MSTSDSFKEHISPLKQMIFIWYERFSELGSDLLFNEGILDGDNGDCLTTYKKIIIWPVADLMGAQPVPSPLKLSLNHGIKTIKMWLS